MENKPVRVLQVLGSLSHGGAETMVMNYFRKINTSEIQFDFLVHKRVVKGYEEEILARGGRIFYIDTLRQSGLFRYIYNIVGILKNKGPFVAVHAHTDYQSGIVAIAAKIAGIQKRICHSHSTNPPTRLTKVLMPIFSLLANKFGNHNIACGVEAGNFLFKSKSFKVLNNAVDINRYSNKNFEQSNRIRKELNIPNDGYVLGHIGRFVPLKNHRFLIELINYLHLKGRKVYLILVGDGPLKSDIEKQVELMGLGSYIKFLGVRDDIPEIFSTMDVFLLPSFSEGIPMVVIEGQAAGKPSIVSNSVSNEVDLGLGLVSFASISEGFQVWGDLLNSSCAINDTVQIEQVFKEKGYDIDHNIKKMEEIYLE